MRTLALFLAACTPSVPATTDADPATDTDTDVPTPELLSSPDCDAMLACDAALGQYMPGYDAVFDGPDDPAYGPGGTCFDEDGVDACGDECATAYDAMVDAADTVVSVGGMTSVPVACGGTVDPATPVPTPPPPEPFAWTITLTDGDGVADASGGMDADTYTVATENSVAHYPDVASWDFGMAQTEIANGWTGEDCTSGQHCHTMLPDTTIVLERVFDLGSIVDGQTTLIPVDFPESTTSGNAYVLFGVSSGGTDIVCFHSGYDAGSYFSGFGCDDYVD